MGKKQIVLIMTDTMRYDMINSYAKTGLSTPNLDNLSNKSIKFKKAYTCQPVCGPARSAIFTGLFPHSNGSVGNTMPLNAGTLTIGQRLKKQNISSAFIGKWHLDGGDYFGNGVCPDGYDENYWYDMRCYLDELTREERLLSRNQNAYKDHEIEEEFTYAHRISNRALDYIDKHNDQDFFLTVSYDEPHQPYLCPNKYVEKYKNFEFPKRENVYDTLEGKPEYQKIWAGDNINKDREKLKLSYPEYFACNEFADYEIGRVLDEIYKKLPDAVIIYTSDHGDLLQSHCITNKGPAMYEEVAKIPFIVNYHGNKGEYNYPVSHIDLVPTILDYFSLPMPKMLEGKSLIPCFEDQSKRINENVFVEFTRYEIDHDGFGGIQMMRAIINERYKLAVHLLDSDEMYDLEKDPFEMRNIINDEKYIQVRNQMHDLLLEEMNETRDPYRGYYWERRPWRTDAKPATWSCTGFTRQKDNDPDELRQLDYDTGVEMVNATRRK